MTAASISIKKSQAFRGEHGPMSEFKKTESAHLSVAKPDLQKESGVLPAYADDEFFAKSAKLFDEVIQYGLAHPDAKD